MVLVSYLVVSTDVRRAERVRTEGGSDAAPPTESSRVRCEPMIEFHGDSLHRLLGYLKGGCLQSTNTPSQCFKAHEIISRPNARAHLGEAPSMPSAELMATNLALHCE